MTFVLWAALAMVGLVIAPVVAHLLRKGRAKQLVFPGAHLVPAEPTTARERNRLEDWPLLVVRGLVITALSVLGAVPLVQCDRLSVARSSGGSVALSIVLDDSLSMRALITDEGPSRFERAKQGAEELLASLREGDAVALVLAGRPARIALAPTTDVESARRALSEVAPSDRATDLSAGISLARSALASLPQGDRRVVVLSDLAGDPLPGGTPPAITPLPELANPVADCGITIAERRGSRVTVSVACTSAEAATQRKVEVVVAEGGDPNPGEQRPAGPSKGKVLASIDLMAREGEQVLSLDIAKADVPLDARLSGRDALPHDDLSPVADETGASRIGVLVDRAQAGVTTGGATVLEQALRAVGDDRPPQPLPVLPGDLAGLASLGALVLDDPAGFPPDERALLAAFAARGGVAMALLGPRSRTPELGSSLEPFAGGAARWEQTQPLGVDPESLGWLGPEALGLDRVARRGRMRLDGAALEGARVIGRWSDGVPFMLERRHKRGLFLTVGLPSSVDESDLSLRPAFLALLEHVIGLADVRSGARRTPAGVPWFFPDASAATIVGPTGPLAVDASGPGRGCAEEPDATCASSGLRATPPVRGRYTVRVDDTTELRLVTLESGEILAKPSRPAPPGGTQTKEAKTPTPASREVAGLLMGLVALELALRVARRFQNGARTAPRPASE